MKACGRGGWTLFMFNRIGLATAPRADEIAPAVTRVQTLPSIPYWHMRWIERSFKFSRKKVELLALS